MLSKVKIQHFKKLNVRFMYKYETLAVHAGQENVDPTTNSRAVPIYATTAYKFNSAEHGRDLFDLKVAGNIYTRLTNPTNSIFEARTAALEGGTGALATSSGHSAQLLTITSLCRNGDNIVAFPYLYGGTHQQFRMTFPQWGIETRFIEEDDPKAIVSLIDEKTKLIYTETMGNPTFQIPDFEMLSKIAKEAGIPLIIDNTFGACGYLCRPFDHGANITVSSATKWIGGHGVHMGGVVVDGGTFPWDNGKFPEFTTPSPGYHGFKCEGLRDLGMCQSPFGSFILLQGFETLPLRMDRISENTIKLANFLKQHKNVSWVNYPGLTEHPHHERAKKYFRKGQYGPVLGFGVKGGKAAGELFINSVKLATHLVNVGDCKTLVTHPASTTHGQLSEEERQKTGVYEDYIRVSVGIEHIDDIIEDFDQALKAKCY